MDKTVTFSRVRPKQHGKPPDVRVCDFPMGGGKTQSLIRAIVLMSLVSEDHRVKRDCPALDFAVPHRGKEDYRPVYEQTISFMKEGRNIASTHAAFRYYKEDIYILAKEMGYSLYIDESVNAVEADRNDIGDIQYLVKRGDVIQDDGGRYILSDSEAVRNYKGSAFKKIFRTFQSRSIAFMDTDIENTKNHATILWNISPELMRQFNDVTIITFNFYGQQFYYYCRAENIPYRLIGVGKDGPGMDDFYFTDNPEEYYYPSYLDNIKDLVHVFEGNKMKSRDYYGRHRTALSMNWYQNPDNVKMVSRQADTFYRRSAIQLTEDYGANRRLWSAYAGYAWKMSKMVAKLTMKNFLSYNTRAVNDYSDRTLLVYAVNLFPNVTVANYWRSRGFEVDDDLYALNHMIQWIWRSAIRNGEEIWVLVPSNRMRDLLKDWLDDPLRYCQIA